MLIVDDLAFIADQPVALPSDQFLASANRDIQQHIEPLWSRPVVRILEKERIVIDMVDDFSWMRRYGPEFSVDFRSVTPGNLASVFVGGVEEQSSITTMPCSSQVRHHRRIDGGFQIFLRLEIGDDSEDARVFGEVRTHLVELEKIVEQLIGVPMAHGLNPGCWQPLGIAEDDPLPVIQRAEGSANAHLVCPMYAGRQLIVSQPDGNGKQIVEDGYGGKGTLGIGQQARHLLLVDEVLHRIGRIQQIVLEYGQQCVESGYPAVLRGEVGANRYVEQSRSDALHDGGIRRLDTCLIVRLKHGLNGTIEIGEDARNLGHFDRS